MLRLQLGLNEYNFRHAKEIISFLGICFFFKSNYEQNEVVCSEIDTKGIKIVKKL